MRILAAVGALILVAACTAPISSPSASRQPIASAPESLSPAASATDRPTFGPDASPTAPATDRPTTTPEITDSPETPQPTYTPQPTDTDSIPTLPTTPEPTTNNEGRWTPLGTAVLIESRFLAWSPDGARILLARHQTNGPPENQFVDVLASNGNLIQTFQGYDEGVWLDDQHLVLTTWDRGAGGSLDYNQRGHPNGTSSVAEIGSEPAPLLINLADGISNGHGAVAFDPADGPAVWEESGLTALPELGDVTAWSRNGSRLLMERALGPGPGPATSPSILSWPDLQTIAQGEDIWYAGSIGALNADLTKSATWDWPPPSDTSHDPIGEKIIDIDTGATHPLELNGPLGDPRWGGDHLVSATFPSGDASEYDSDGQQLHQWKDVGLQIFAAQAAPVFAFVNEDELSPRTINLAHGSRVLALQTAGQIQSGAFAVKLSPDGTKLVVVCLSGSNEETAYLTSLD